MPKIALYPVIDDSQFFCSLQKSAADFGQREAAMPHDLVGRQNGPGPGTAELDPAFLAESRTTEILTVECVIFSIAFAVVLLRIYCRVFMLRAFSVDDYTMLGAVVSLHSLLIDNEWMVDALSYG